MKDRTPTYPGRVKLVPVAGQENTYDLTWADEPTQTGTPLNKATLLSDAVATLLGLAQDDPTISDALEQLHKYTTENFAKVTVAEREPTVTDAGHPGYLWLNSDDTENYEYKLSICIGGATGAYIWRRLVYSQKKMYTVIFTNTTSWTVPAHIGGIWVMCYGGGGGGGGGSRGSSTKPTIPGGGGGGGGYMQTGTFDIVEKTAVQITIGGGGVGGKSSNYGVSGGTTSFGTYLSAVGGTGGKSGGYGGGNGGSGGGAPGYANISYVKGGVGAQFGNGGDSFRAESPQAATAGVDTTGIADIPDIGKGTGAAGESGSGEYYSGGGGGGYGGCGGSGGAGGQSTSSDFSGGGGGGGYGSSGNGGDCGQNNGGTGAGGGGGGSGMYNAGGNGGAGICIVRYYNMVVVEG